MCSLGGARATEKKVPLWWFRLIWASLLARMRMVTSLQVKLTGLYTAHTFTFYLNLQQILGDSYAMFENKSQYRTW